MSELSRPTLGGLARGWTGFWFAPESCATQWAMRTGLGALTLLWALSFGPDLWAFYGEGGVLPEPHYASHRLAVFQWFHADGAFLVGYLGLLAAAVLVLWGRAVRPASVVLFVLVMSFQLANTLVLNAGDILIRILCAYLALYALATPAAALGPDLGSLRRGGTAFSLAAPWFRRLVQIQLSLVYFFSVIDKFQGQSWMNGTAVPRALQLVEFQRFALPACIQFREPRGDSFIVEPVQRDEGHHVLTSAGCHCCSCGYVPNNLHIAAGRTSARLG